MFCGIFIQPSAYLAIGNIDMVTHYLMHQIENERSLGDAMAHLTKSLGIPINLKYSDMDLNIEYEVTDVQPTRWSLVLGCDTPCVEEMQ
jgi:hypothetical protein